MNVSFLQEILNTVAERGRHLLPRALVGIAPAQEIADLARALVSVRGEASGVVLARQVLARYRELTPSERHAFFLFLADSLGPDLGRVREAAEAFLAEPGERAFAGLLEAVEPPRQEFFRRLNLGPGATAGIVALRRDLLAALEEDARLGPVDNDLMHLLGSWFNRGFLVLRRIDWSTPANILEKIIAYEAVHEIQGWDDLRRRLDPVDRRCFGFFHPSLVDEPLIFVEVALMREIPGSIQQLLDQATGTDGAGAAPTTAVFYSISNCQDGLRGISFGNFLIKQVVEELARELPSLKTFVTLSPVPGFARWLEEALADPRQATVPDEDRVTLQLLNDPAWVDEAEAAEELEGPMLALAAHYFLRARQPDGRPIDPVARFHLGNGARLERINWLGDVSGKGLAEAHGLMVNYLYEIKEIERNHEAYANDGLVTASRAVRTLLRAPEKGRGPDLPARPALPPTRPGAAVPELARMSPSAASEEGGEPSRAGATAEVTSKPSARSRSTRVSEGDET